MIIYIASYPRSGNSFVRGIIINTFGYPVSAVNHGRPVPIQEQFEEIAANWRVPGEYNPKDYDRSLIWNKWIALYDRKIPPLTRENRFLLRGCRSIINEVGSVPYPPIPAILGFVPRKTNIRRSLANEGTSFFLKTHAFPFKKYYEGEYVIQPVRHPGAVFRSYLYFLNDIRGKPTPHERIITGDDLPYGSWSTYHQFWNATRNELGEKRFYQVRFNDMVSNPHALRDWIHRTIGLPYDMDTQDPARDFEKMHELNPSYYKFGKDIGWEETFSRRQLEMIWQNHHEMMRVFGFSEPDYARAHKESVP